MTRRRYVTMPPPETCATILRAYAKHGSMQTAAYAAGVGIERARLVIKTAGVKARRGYGHEKGDV